MIYNKGQKTWNWLLSNVVSAYAQSSMFFGLYCISCLKGADAEMFLFSVLSIVKVEVFSWKKNTYKHVCLCLYLWPNNQLIITRKPFQPENHCLEFLVIQLPITICITPLKKDEILIHVAYVESMFILTSKTMLIVLLLIISEVVIHLNSFLSM